MYQTVMKLDGMACGMCEAHVNDAVRRCCPVKKVTSSCKTGTAEIITDDAPEVEKLAAAIQAAGYTVLDSHTEPYEKKGLLSFLKR